MPVGSSVFYLRHNFGDVYCTCTICLIKLTIGVLVRVDDFMKTTLWSRQLISSISDMNEEIEMKIVNYYSSINSTVCNK